LLLCVKSGQGKQWKTIIILSILNFALSNGLSTWGVKYISSGLGAILNAVFLCGCNHYFFRRKIGQTGYSGLNNKFWGRLRYLII
jgi:hypothetical protein